MKKINLSLVLSGFFLTFVSTAYADTSAPKAPPAPTGRIAPTAPGVSRPSTPDPVPSTETDVPSTPDTVRLVKPVTDPSRAIPVDPDARKNEADFKSKVEECNAIVDKDSKAKCMNDAETAYINRNHKPDL